MCRTNSIRVLDRLVLSRKVDKDVDLGCLTKVDSSSQIYSDLAIIANNCFAKSSVRVLLEILISATVLSGILSISFTVLKGYWFLVPLMLMFVIVICLCTIIMFNKTSLETILGIYYVVPRVIRQLNGYYIVDINGKTYEFKQWRLSNFSSSAVVVVKYCNGLDVLYLLDNVWE